MTRTVATLHEGAIRKYEADVGIRPGVLVEILEQRDDVKVVKDDENTGN